MEIKIFIQQTEDGSKVVFPLEYNEFAPEYKKFQFFLKDEAHKADFANAYSLQINNEFKIYSLISSEISDYLGRSGSFFAIRVVIPNQKSIDDIQNLLNNIKDKYMEHYQNKTMEELSFKDLTDAIEDNTFGYNNNAIVTHGIDKEAYILWDKLTSLNSYFTQKAASLVKSLYIFDREKTEPIVYERMLPFDEVKPLIRKIEITSNGLLESLKVNDIEINKPSSNSFDLITTTDAKVTYIRKDKKGIRVLNDLNNTITLYPEQPAPRKPSNPSNPDSPKATIIAISLLFVLIVGILGWFYWDSLNTEKLNEPTNTVSNAKIIEKKEDKNLVEFKIIDTINKHEKRYGVVKPDSLSSFEFIYNNGWSYINKKQKNIPVDFSKKSIKEIFESKKIKYNDTINNNFIAELEKISKEKISEEKNEKVTKSKDNETVVAKKKTEQKNKALDKNQKETSNADKKVGVKQYESGAKDN